MKEKMLLIFDLDETLVHATKNLIRSDYDFQVFEYFVYKRPYLAEFLHICNQHFQLAVWSSAGEEYVKAIVAHIFPKEIELAFIWSANRCTPKYFPEHDNSLIYTKPLKKAKKYGFSLNRMLILDNTPQKVMQNYGNAIYPKSYRGEGEDNDLNLLANYLISLKDAENVRKIEKRFWKKQD
jgi:RNA polymerase II subunit A small phosphatase-like protein